MGVASNNAKIWMADYICRAHLSRRAGARAQRGADQLLLAAARPAASRRRANRRARGRGGPENPLAHFTLGTTLRQLRRDKEAIEAYEKAVALDPTMTKAWVNLAVSSERFNRARSVEALAKVLAAEPETSSPSTSS